MPDNDSIQAEIPMFDLKVVADFLIAIGMNVDNPEVSDAEFRKIISEKVGAMQFLVDSGVVEPPSEEAMEIVLGMIEERNEQG